MKSYVVIPAYNEENTIEDMKKTRVMEEPCLMA
jgi:hypothetical protein